MGVQAEEGKKKEIDLATESQRFFHPLQIAANVLTDAHMRVIDIFFKDCKKKKSMEIKRVKS